MPTTISTASKQIVSNMIRNAFLDIDDQPWNDEKLYELIVTAEQFGLYDLANELIHTLPHQYQRNEILNRHYTKPLAK